MAQANCTCSVGRELIKGNWKEAVRLLMSGHEGERADSAAARKLFLEDGDIAGALKQMPRHLTVERAILEASPFPFICVAPSGTLQNSWPLPFWAEVCGAGLHYIRESCHMQYLQKH